MSGCIIYRLGFPATERHVHDRLSNSGMLNHPVNAGQDTRGRACTIGVQDLDTNNMDLLGDPVLGASNRTSDVSTVPILVRVGGAGDKVGTKGDPTPKVSVGGINTNVQNKGSDTLSCRIAGKIRLSQVQVCLSDTSQTPGRGIRLRSQDSKGGVLLDIVNLGG